MSEVIVIQSDLRKTEKQRLRVGAYARVSSNSLEQEDSFHNQVRYYTKYIASNPEWEFVDIYADEGITGTRQDKLALTLTVYMDTVRMPKRTYTYYPNRLPQ